MNVDISKPLAYVFLVPIALLMTLLNAWVISYLWVWFAVPLGLPLLTISQLMGLLFIKTVAFYRYRSDIRTDKGIKLFFYTICNPLLILILGYIVRFWVM